MKKSLCILTVFCLIMAMFIQPVFAFTAHKGANVNQANHTAKTTAEIAQAYNDAVNLTKAYKGEVSVKRVEGVTTAVTEIGLGLKSIAEEALPNTYPEIREGAFSYGVATADSRTKKDEEKKVLSPGAKLADYLPPPSGKNAALSAAGIKSATYTETESGYKLEITLVKEMGDSINYIPPYHSCVMDTLAINEDDLGDFRVMNAAVTYDGAVIVADVNAQGLLTSLSINEAVNITGKVGHKNFSDLGVNVVLDGNWKQDITFTYSDIESEYLILNETSPTASDILSQLPGTTVLVFRNGVLLDGDDFVGTGCVFKIMDGVEVVGLIVLVIKGDVDGDGKVGVPDARKVLRVAVNLENFNNNPAAAQASDVVGTNKKTEVSDARKILRVAVGLENF